MTREDVFRMEDQELIDYYDKCIAAFLDMENRQECLKRMEKEDVKTTVFHLVMGGTLLLCSIILFALTVIAVFCFLWNLSFFGEWIFLDIGMQDNTALNIYMIILLILMIIGITVLIRKPDLTCSILKAMIWDKDAIEKRNSEINLYRQEIEAIKAGPSDYCDALIIFPDDKSVEYVAELRTIVYKALARTHKEAVERQIRIQREKKDDAFREEVLQVLKSAVIKKEDLSDEAEKYGSIASSGISIIDFISKWFLH